MSTPTLDQLRAANFPIVRRTTSKFLDGDIAYNDVFHRVSDGTHWLAHYCIDENSPVISDVTVIQVAPIEKVAVKVDPVTGESAAVVETHYHEVRG